MRTCADKFKDLPRNTRGSRYDFSGPERAYQRRLMRSERYEDLAIFESSRAYINRGRNDYYENTSFGYGSTSLSSSIIKRIMLSFIGKNIDDLMTYISKNFRGLDRYSIESHIVSEFYDSHKFEGHGRSLRPYGFSLDGNNIIGHVPYRRHTRGTSTDMVFVVPVDSTHCYVVQDDKWYRCEVAEATEFIKYRWDPIRGMTLRVFGVDAFGQPTSTNKSWLAGYTNRNPWTPSKDHVNCIGHERYSNMYVLRKHSASSRDLKIVNAYIKAHIDKNSK